MLPVTAIIVSYNTRDLLARCLECLLPEATVGLVRVIVVDNASHDGSVEMLRERFPTVELIASETNRGFAAANNLALRTLATPYVLLLNSDAEVAPGAIAALLDCAERHPDAGAVGPRLVNGDGSLQRSCWRFPTLWRAFFDMLFLPAIFPRVPVLDDYRHWPHDAERAVDFTIGAALLVRRAAIERVGLLDEGFFLYAEETDWLFRMRRAGWKTYFTSATEVLHHGGASGKALPGRTFDLFHRSKDRYYRKHYGPGGLLMFKCCTVAGLSLRLLLSRTASAERRGYGRLLRWHLRTLRAVAG